MQSSLLSNWYSLKTQKWQGSDLTDIWRSHVISLTMLICRRSIQMYSSNSEDVGNRRVRGYSRERREWFQWWKAFGWSVWREILFVVMATGSVVCSKSTSLRASIKAWSGFSSLLLHSSPPPFWTWERWLWCKYLMIRDAQKTHGAVSYLKRGSCTVIPGPVQVCGGESLSCCGGAWGWCFFLF